MTPDDIRKLPEYHDAIAAAEAWADCSGDHSTVEQEHKPFVESEIMVLALAVAREAEAPEASNSILSWQLFGVPCRALLNDARFIRLMRQMVIEQGGDPESWVALVGAPEDQEAAR